MNWDTHPHRMRPFFQNGACYRIKSHHWRHRAFCLIQVDFRNLYFKVVTSAGTWDWFNICNFHMKQNGSLWMTYGGGTVVLLFGGIIKDAPLFISRGATNEWWSTFGDRIKLQFAKELIISP